jgi:putative Mg2+ transporter-C (MgtC) family protein
MLILPEDVLKVVLAVLVGGLIGFEREFRDKAAGFRTMIFICIGATLFTIFSIKLGGDRVASTIVTGIGFLGAGVIMRESGRVTGLTTAATIWLTSAMGMGLGRGEYLLVFVATAISLAVLWLFPRWEERIKQLRDDRVYEVVCPLSQDKLAQLRSLIRQSGLRLKGEKQGKVGSDMRCVWDAYGSPAAHDRFVEALFADSEVKEFRF